MVDCILGCSNQFLLSVHIQTQHCRREDVLDGIAMGIDWPWILQSYWNQCAITLQGPNYNMICQFTQFVNDSTAT